MFPDEAKVLSAMAQGFTYSEAWNMSYRDYNRYSSIAQAWSIPPDMREGTIRRATKADSYMLL